MLDGDNRTAWCEGVRGNGNGEEIAISIRDGIPFRRLILQNGYGKSARAFGNNGRARTIEIATDLGDVFQTRLPDNSDDVIVNLPRLAEYRNLRIRILDVYPGAKYQDTCLNFITPDLEYERYLELKSQGLL
ncbi:discoidin domain-containing protein [Tropicimonas sp. TH_r6]|nr:discoidin domain-containing protein [Tropicimonas sp. TH_r6]MDV7143284.1 discoidin domain-containing protein [Tropicimonas sp. TH_r6]